MERQWTYSATKAKQDAYEDIIDKLNPCSSEEFKQMSEEQQDALISNMIQEIRKINVFPIYYFNKEGIKKEIKAAIDKKVCFTGNVLDLSYAQGLVLLDFLFPNLHDVHAGDNNNKTIYERFYDDEILKTCLKSALKTRKICNMRTAFFAAARFLWRTATNYSPMRAKAIYEKFCPKGGVIYDYSAGFGGRMLGALSSSYDFHYIATDPNTETFHNLLNLRDYIAEVKPNIKCDLGNEGSETFALPEASVDFAFSCPPFFTLEKYSDEETQSVNKFPVYEEWLENYVRPTIKNCISALKETGLYGVNIVNFWQGGKKYMVAEDWLRIAKEEGLVLQGIFPIVSKARKNEEDQDQIYIFSKSKDITLPDYTDADTVTYWEQKLAEHAKKKDKKLYISQYDIFGNLIETYEAFDEIDFEEKDIKAAIKSKKPYNDFYFKTFKEESAILNTLEVKQPICLIDGIYFHTFAEAGRYLDTPRQTIAQAKGRQSKKILGHEVTWF